MSIVLLLRRAPVPALARTAVPVGEAAIKNSKSRQCWLGISKCSIAFSALAGRNSSSTDELRTVVLSSHIYVVARHCVFGRRS